MFWRERSSLPYKLYWQEQVGAACLHEPLGGIMAWLPALLASGLDWVRIVCLHEPLDGIESGLSALLASGLDWVRIVHLAGRQGRVRA